MLELEKLVDFNVTNDFFAYDAENDQWFGGVPPLPGAARTSAISFSIEGKGYVGTGGSGCGSVDFYEYKLNTNSWIQRADVGLLIRNEAFGFAVNGKGYVLTGDNCSSGTNYKDFWEYDPNTDVWTELEEFPGAARRYMNGFVVGGKVFCGSGTSGTNYSDLWEYDQSLSVLERDNSLLNVNLFPNPSIENVTFEISDLPQGILFEQLALVVVDVTGRLVFDSRFEESNLTLVRNDPYCWTVLLRNYVQRSKSEIRKIHISLDFEGITVNHINYH